MSRAVGAGGVVKRSVAIAGHRTSVSLEAPFWAELHEIARQRGRSAQALVA
jgi:predicted DNA-binding ribbon-helix-helix protein